MEILVTVLCCLVFFCGIQLRKLFIKINSLVDELQNMVRVKVLLDSMVIIESDIKQIKEQMGKKQPKEKTEKPKDQPVKEQSIGGGSPNPPKPKSDD